MPELIDRDRRGLRVLLTAACFVVVVAGLREAGAFLLPVLFALFLSLLAIPPMRRLQGRGLPAWAAITIVIVVATMAVLGVSIIVGRSVVEFQGKIPVYRDELNLVVRDALGWLSVRGVDVPTGRITEMIDTGSIMTLVADTALGLLSALSNLFLVLLTMIFLLLEAQGLPRKLRIALDDPSANLSEFSRVATNVQRYLATKAWVSLLTGLLVALLTWAVGLEFVWLWALIAFLFNFVPNIGSIIAAVPAVLLGLLELTLVHALVTAAGYVAINMAIGNGLEPRLMGRRLGLSTLVVWMSMLFWGWVWGPVGMLLSVPLTVIVKIMLEHSDDFRWLAALLGPRGDQLPPHQPHPAPHEEPPPAAP